MQGQRGIIGSLPDTLDFDHGSSSNNATIDQQICWNNMRHPVENRMADFMMPPSLSNNTYVSSSDQERQNPGQWSIGESSSSGVGNRVVHDDQKMEHRWLSSASACPGVGPTIEERQHEPSRMLALDGVNVNPQSAQSSNSGAISQDLNLNPGFVGCEDENCQVMEGSDMYKCSAAENERNQPTSSSDTFLFPPGSGGCLVEENDGRPGCSLDRRRQSYKRKAVEGNVGQSSMSGDSSFPHRADSGAWPDVHAHYDVGRSLTIPGPAEQANPRLALGVRGIASDCSPDSSFAGQAESSQRNFRMRLHPSSQESPSPTLFSTGSAIRRCIEPSPNQSARFLSLDHSLELRPSSAMDSIAPQNQPTVIPVPALPQNVPSFTWTESFGPRTGSSSSMTSGDREETSFRSTARNIWEHPTVVPLSDLRTSARNPANRTGSGGNLSIPGNVTSTSRAGTSSSVHPVSAPAWVPYPNPPTSRNSRRLAEYVRRSLFSPPGDSGGQSSTHSPLHSGPPASSEETGLSSGAANQGHNRSYPRSASWMERHGDGVLGIPYPLRTLGAAGEGRSRLVSEIRNVLDLMRRGEGLRFEDIMILDQSVLFGVADIHDRHRDMRLDVDNMSYEELLALEEQIGNVSTGLSEETILKKLKQWKYSNELEADKEAEPCSVCQEEYNSGEDLGTLDCGHDFHTDCIKQWLMLKNWCPICKTTGLSAQEEKNKHSGA